jgi:hypothetical protein
VGGSVPVKGRDFSLHPPVLINFHIQELLATPAGVKSVECEANLLPVYSTESLACMESLPSHPVIQLGREYFTFAFSFSSQSIFIRDLTVLQNLKKATTSMYLDKCF